MAIVLVISVAVTRGITPKRPICGCQTVPVKNSRKVTPGVLKNKPGLHRQNDDNADGRQDGQETCDEQQRLESWPRLAESAA